MGVTKTRSTRRSRNRNRKFILFLIGVGLLLAALVFWTTATLQKSTWEPARVAQMMKFAIGSCSAGVLALIIRQLIGITETHRRSRRRKRYEDYKHALDGGRGFKMPEDWEE